jgi:hypothetical protein
VALSRQHLSAFEGARMSHHHVIAKIDHHGALIQRIEGEDVSVERLAAHTHATRQHGSEVRSVHEFFGTVCDKLQSGGEILVVGNHTSLADFRHYVEKHRTHLAPRIVGWEVVDKLTDGQLTALARDFFSRYDKMQGTASL